MVKALQQLVGDALDRLEKEARDDGRRWSVRALEDAHGINNGTLGQVAKGNRKSIESKNVPKVAAALGLSVADLIAAQAEAPEAEVPVPPSNRRAVVAETPTEVFERAFDNTRHHLQDYEAVKQLLREHPLMAGEADPVVLITAWLDSAARIRDRGAKADAQAILTDLALRIAAYEQTKPRPKSA